MSEDRRKFKKWAAEFFNKNERKFSELEGDEISIVFVSEKPSNSAREYCRIKEEYILQDQKHIELGSKGVALTLSLEGFENSNVEELITTLDKISS